MADKDRLERYIDDKDTPEETITRIKTDYAIIQEIRKSLALMERNVGKPDAVLIIEDANNTLESIQSILASTEKSMKDKHDIDEVDIDIEKLGKVIEKMRNGEQDKIVILEDNRPD